jgi:hypothetical protein
MQVSLLQAHEITIDALQSCPHYRAEALIVTAAYVAEEDWYPLQQHLLRCDEIGKQWLRETRDKI